MSIAEIARRAASADELTDAQRGRIWAAAMAAALVQSGFSPAQIAREWGMTRMGVAYRVEQFERMRAGHGA